MKTTPFNQDDGNSITKQGRFRWSAPDMEPSSDMIASNEQIKLFEDIAREIKQKFGGQKNHEEVDKALHDNSWQEYYINPAWREDENLQFGSIIGDEGTNTDEVQVEISDKTLSRKNSTYTANVVSYQILQHKLAQAEEEEKRQEVQAKALQRTLSSVPNDASRRRQNFFPFPSMVDNNTKSFLPQSSVQKSSLTASAKRAIFRNSKNATGSSASKKGSFSNPRSQIDSQASIEPLSPSWQLNRQQSVVDRIFNNQPGYGMDVLDNNPYTLNTPLPLDLTDREATEGSRFGLTADDMIVLLHMNGYPIDDALAKGDEKEILFLVMNMVFLFNENPMILGVRDDLIEIEKVFKGKSNGRAVSLSWQYCKNDEKDRLKNLYLIQNSVDRARKNILSGQKPQPIYFIEPAKPLTRLRYTAMEQWYLDKSGLIKRPATDAEKSEMSAKYGITDTDKLNRLCIYEGHEGRRQTLQRMIKEAEEINKLLTFDDIRNKKISHPLVHKRFTEYNLEFPEIQEANQKSAKNDRCIMM